MRKLIVLTLFCAAIFLSGSVHAQTKDGAYLKKATLKEYVPCDDKDLRENPKSFDRKKIKLEISFTNKRSYHLIGDSDYDWIDPDLPGSKTLRSNLMRSRYYHFMQEDRETAVPIVISITDKPKLIPIVEKFRERDDIVIFGRVKLFVPKVSMGQDKGRIEYMVQVDDVMLKEGTDGEDKDKGKGKDDKADDDKAKSGAEKKLNIEKNPGVK